MRFDPYNDTALFIYKLETSDLPRGDILQIGVVMTALNMEGGAVDEFYIYVIPEQGYISTKATEVNNLYWENGKMTKRLGDSITNLRAFPLHVALKRLWKWVFRRSMGRQTVLAGYNNSRFDDHIMLSVHLEQNTSRHTFQRIVDNVFFTDFRRAGLVDIKSFGKGGLKKLYKRLGGTRNMDHVGALGKCKALLYILEKGGIEVTEALDNVHKVRSFESLMEDHDAQAQQEVEDSDDMYWKRNIEKMRQSNADVRANGKGNSINSGVLAQLKYDDEFKNCLEGLGYRFTF